MYETQEFKQYYKGVTERIKKIKDRWDKYAKLSTSYGQNDTAIEDGMWTTSRVKLDDMGTEIILRNLRNGTPEKIKDELAKALVRSNVDLLEEQERPWTLREVVILKGMQILHLIQSLHLTSFYLED